MYGQLKGKYCYNGGFVWECINFLDSNKFEIYSGSCTNNDSGKGVFTIKGNNLFLQFETDKTKKKNEILFEKESTNTDSITIEIIICDERNDALFNASAHIENRNLGIAVNTNGVGKFNVPRTSDVQSLIISYVGYKQLRIPIQLDGNYKIKVILAEEIGRDYDSEDRIILKIKSIRKDDSILLKHNYKYSRYETYKLRK